MAPASDRARKAAPRANLMRSGREIAMSVEAPGTNPTRIADDPEPGRATSEPKSGVWSRLSRVGWRLAQSLGATGGVLSLIWAAYTYSNQSTQQRRQDLLSAF